MPSSCFVVSYRFIVPCPFPCYSVLYRPNTRDVFIPFASMARHFASYCMSHGLPVIKRTQYYLFQSIVGKAAPGVVCETASRNYRGDIVSGKLMFGVDVTEGAQAEQTEAQSNAGKDGAGKQSGVKEEQQPRAGKAEAGSGEGELEQQEDVKPEEEKQQDKDEGKKQQARKEPEHSEEPADMARSRQGSKRAQCLASVAQFLNRSAGGSEKKA